MERPFTGGMVTDFPAHEIGATNSTYAQDLYSPQGVAIQRKGWAFDGSTADVADNLVGVYRAQFALADVTRTLTCDDDGDFFIHNSGGAGTALFTGTVQYLPRCVYGDELIFCAQDGQTPLRRYAGVAGSSYTSAPSTFNSGKATITATSSNYGTPEVGMYLYGRTLTTPAGGYCFKILEVNSTTSLTAEGIISTSTTAVSNEIASITGTTTACVNVYDAGTATTSGGTSATVTGTGTKWSSGGWGAVLADSTIAGDCLLGNMDSIGTNFGSHTIESVASDTSLVLHKVASCADKSYQILRRCPFKDATTHKTSLWGTGVAQYPNRVYVGPPGWNLSYPPGFTLPIDVALAQESANQGDFLMDFVDVPTPYDGDHNVAILPSPNHLWVLKREKAHGIYGSYGGLEVSRDPIGPGCIDIRSAIAVAEGAFWASEDDVFWAPGQTAQPLMVGKIQREWRALTRDFDYGTSDYVSCGVASGHLFVHITTAGGTVQRTYLCDLRDQSWQSRVSNVTPRYMFTSRVPGEKEKLLAVSNDRQGRVLDLAPMLDGSGTADDDAGSAPRLQAHSPKIGGDGTEGVSRWVDLAVHANVYDAGAAGTTSMTVSAISEGGIGNPAAATKTLTDIESDTADNLNRHHRRVARDGRLHQVQIAVDATGTDTTATKVEVDQIDLFLRDGRKRSR